MAAPTEMGMGDRIFRGKLSLYSFNSMHHPLHLGLHIAKKTVGIGNDADNSAVVAVDTNVESLTTAKNSCHFASVVFLDPEPGADSKHGAGAPSASDNQSNEPSDILPLFCTNQFLTHYNYSEGDVVYFRMINLLLPITKVVIHAKSDQAYQWAQRNCFCTGLLLSVCQEHKVLVRQGDALLAPYSTVYESPFDMNLFLDFEVFECSPTQQGVLSVKTEFVVVNRSHIKATKSDLKDQSNHIVSCIPLLLSDFAHVPGILSTVNARYDKKENSVLGRTVDLQQQWNTIMLKEGSAIASSSCLKWEDSNSVIVSMQTAEKYELFHESYIQVRLPHRITETDNNPLQNGLPPLSPENKHAPINGMSQGLPLTASNINIEKQKRICKYHIRTVQVKVVSPNDIPALTSDVMYGMHSFLCQLNQYQQPSDEIEKIEFKKYSVDKEYGISASSSWTENLPFATEVHLCCIFSPQYNVSSAFNAAIQHHFRTTRLLQRNDVIALRTTVDPEFYQNPADGSINRQPFIYFKVKKILPKATRTQAFLIDVDHTTVFQDTAVHAYVPSVVEVLGQTGTVQPPGLEAHIKDLAQLTQPYVKQRDICGDRICSVLLVGASGSGKVAITRSLAAALSMHCYEVNCHDLCGDTSAATEARITHTLQKAAAYAPCVLLLCDIQALGKDRDGTTEDPRVSSFFHAECVKKLREESTDWPVVVIATTPAVKLVTSDMAAGFLYTKQVEAPDEDTRYTMLRALLRNVTCVPSLAIRHVAQRTAGMVLGDLRHLVVKTQRVMYERLLQSRCPGRRAFSRDDELCVALAGCSLEQADFDEALNVVQAALSDAIGAPKIPSVTWDDVGGLVKVKAEILDTIQLPLQHPELFAAGLRRSGVLLYGPPGTGKTLLAKAVATECALNFLSVKGPELINMYVGQSEENIREVFARARTASPCVIFFDELDSLAPNRGRSGDSGGVMDRVVSQLLAELDGLNKATDVFVIGATNRPDLLDSALLRPGRFDKLLFLGVSQDHESQLKILRALTRKFTLAPTCRLGHVAEVCPFTMTGADFYALCSDAMLNALKRKIDLLEAGETVDQDKVTVDETDFLTALDCLVPSVSEAELQHFAQLERFYATRK